MRRREECQDGGEVDVAKEDVEREEGQSEDVLGKGIFSYKIYIVTIIT